MSNKAYYIVTVAGGKCLENPLGKGPWANNVPDCYPKDIDAQKWIFETDGDDANVVAIKNCADGKYLHNLEPDRVDWGHIGMREEKQYWTIQKGRYPRSCAIKSNACTRGGSYLNDFNGEYLDNHYVHLWSWVDHLDWWLTWYIVDAETAGQFNPATIQAPAGVSAEEMEAREKAVAEKEQNAAQRLQDAERKEAGFRDREQKVAEQEAALKKPAGAPKQQSASSDDTAQKLKEIAEKEGAIRKREQDLAAREAALKNQAAASNSGPAGNDTSEIDRLQAENDNLKLQLRIKDLENQLEKARESSQSSGASKPALSSSTPKAPGSKVNDPASGTSTKPTGSGAKPNGTPSRPINGPASGTSTKPTVSGATPNRVPSRQPNGVTNPPAASTALPARQPMGATKPSTTANTSRPLAQHNHNHNPAHTHTAAENDGAIVFSCGHVAYPLPRKVEKKVVGILYEGAHQPHSSSVRQQAAVARKDITLR